jgi:hypothetical protein
MTGSRAIAACSIVACRRSRGIVDITVKVPEVIVEELT